MLKKENLKYLIILIGIIWAYQSHWLCDDAFVTFRYIANLKAGNGLVYNAGEYVEGFTHPLWLFILFISNQTGVTLEFLSQFWGIVFFGLVLYLLIIKGWIASILLVFNQDAIIWATSGLETMFFTFLVLFSFISKDKKYLGWILLAMLLTRPDGIVIVVIFIIWEFSHNKVYFRFYPLLLYGVYELFRIFYYGDWLPNVYYTKSAGLFYFSQGLDYLWIYFKIYIVSFLVILSFKFIKNKEIQLALLIIFSYLFLFVARVGGDFMYARFIIPVVPLIYLVIEKSLRLQFPKVKKKSP